MKRRALWTFALAAPAVVAAENLMPVVAPPTYAIPAGGAYPWERVTEARARGWDHHRRHRGYDTGIGTLAHSQRAARRWKRTFWHAGGVAPPPNDAPFTTLWLPERGGGDRVLLQYRDGEAWGCRGISAVAAGRLGPEADRTLVYDGPGALPEFIRRFRELDTPRPMAAFVASARADGVL